jgi:hypothetical protein
MAKGLNKKIKALAAEQAATSREMLAIGHDSLDFSKQQYADSQAELERLRPTLDALAAGQIQSTTLANDITKQARDDYNTTYRPLEQRVAADATAAGSAGEQETAAGRAGIDVQRAIDLERGASDRSMASMGVNPNSGKFVGANRTAAILGAAARAGAETGAREREKLRGDMMRSSAAAMGRGMTGTALTGIQVGGGAAGQAAGLASAGSDRGNAIGQQYLGNMSGAAGIYGNAANVAGNAAGTYNNLGQLKLAQAAQSSSGYAALGSGLGSIAGMAMMFSDENMKTGKRKVRGAREAIDGMRVEKWKYKPGEVADDAEHVGTYAQDFQRETGLGDGRTISVIDAIGVNMAATKELSRDLKSLRKTIQQRGVAA